MMALSLESLTGLSHLQGIDLLDQAALTVGIGSPKTTYLNLTDILPEDLTPVVAEWKAAAAKIAAHRQDLEDANGRALIHWSGPGCEAYVTYATQLVKTLDAQVAALTTMATATEGLRVANSAVVTQVGFAVVSAGCALIIALISAVVTIGVACTGAPITLGASLSVIPGILTGIAAFIITVINAILVFLTTTLSALTTFTNSTSTQVANLSAITAAKSIKSVTLPKFAPDKRSPVDWHSDNEPE
jgi:hypothetical protein